MIGLYGGTFDPVHFGHLNLAIRLAESYSLDEIWFCPARINPLKQQGALASDVHRLDMLKLALEDFPHAKIYPGELQRTEKSYTIDTIKEIRQHTQIPLALLLGSDVLSSLSEWREIQEICKLCTLLIGSRPGESIPDNSVFPPEILHYIKRGWTPIPEFPISSTEIRERLQKKLYCGHLVPRKVLDYISSHQLY